MNRGHENFKEQLPAYLLDALEPAERSGLEHHLEGCAECRAELAWLEPASEVLADDVAQLEASPGLKAKVMAAVDADLEANPAPRPESVTEAEPRRVGQRRSRRPGWLASLLRPAVLGAATAALVVGIALGVVLGPGDDSPSAPTREVVTGQSTIGADAVMVASNGTGTLKLTHLKRPEGDQVYQAWIQRGQVIEPTESLFVPDREGSAVASIPDIDGVSAVMVSAEPKGGSPQPTSAPVVTVSLPG